MAWVAVAVAGVNLVGGMMSSHGQQQAAGDAGAAQVQAAQLGVDEQRRQFDAVRSLLNPYVNAGTNALAGQQDLLGVNGYGPQMSAIANVGNSPAFGVLMKQGEDAILSNASATGGLRGGNVQGALAQFRPQLLAQFIDQQYGRLGGLTGLGQNAAAGVGNAGMQTGSQISQLLQQSGAAQAGVALANGRAQSGMINSITGGVGQLAGMGGFGSTPPNYGGYTPPSYGPMGSYADSPFQMNALI